MRRVAVSKVLWLTNNYGREKVGDRQFRAQAATKRRRMLCRRRSPSVGGGHGIPF